LSRFVFLVAGFDDPISCSIIKCITIKPRIVMGSKKCNEKNRFRVGWETEGPPQIQVMMSIPRIGIADRTPVITVAPQNDICPHGSTYPRNAVAIVISISTTPVSQTFG